ncbi:MAG: NAD-dependent epimerase/dehydratase family protein, partial [Chloroflexota bacterium]
MTCLPVYVSTCLLTYLYTYMRILITGSSGQIGTNLALLLEKQGHYVFGVDK